MNIAQYIIAALLPFSLSAAGITSISVTAETQESETSLFGSLSVSAPPFPIDIASGAGLVINPDIGYFSIHSHIYDTAHRPQNAFITFGFSSPAIVDSLNVVQHANGVTKIEGFVGDSLASMTSMGDIFGPLGDVTGGSSFVERSNYLFDFNNTIPGIFYKFVITKTALVDGYAAYNVNPLDSTGQPFQVWSIPEPSTSAAWAGVAAICFLGFRMRSERLTRRNGRAEGRGAARGV